MSCGTLWPRGSWTGARVSRKQVGLNLGVRGQEEGEAGRTAERVSPGWSLSQIPLIRL